METKIIAIFALMFLLAGVVELVAAVYAIIKDRNLPEQKEREDMEQIEYLKISTKISSYESLWKKKKSEQSKKQ